MRDVLAILLGGGRGARLYPLTRKRSEPAVPSAGKPLHPGNPHCLRFCHAKLRNYSF